MKKFTLVAIMALFAILAFGQPVQKTVTSIEKTTELLPVRNNLRNMGSARSDLRISQNVENSPKTPRTLAFPNNAKPFCSVKADSIPKDGIIVKQPEGELKAYLRKGQCYFSEDFTNYDQRDFTGYLEVVYAPDGKTVYFKEILSALIGLGGWVQGTLSEDGKKIHIPTGQNLVYMEESDCYMQLSSVVYNEATKAFEKDKQAKEITLSIVNEKQIVFDNSDDHHIVGMTFGNDDSWSGFGDYNTTFNLFEEQTITPPEGLTKKNYVLNGKDLYENNVAQSVSIMVDGKDVYLQGLGMNYNPKAWVKGSIEGNKITIPSGQYMGVFQGGYLLYAVTGKLNGVDNVTPQDLVFTYDEAKQAYKTDQVIGLGDNKQNAKFYNIISHIVMTKGLDISFSTDVIREQPAGKVKIYQRRGLGYTVDRGTVFTSYQDGNTMEITYADDGKTVYLKDPISQIYGQSWVKGTINGNQLTVPAFQCIIYEPEVNLGAIMARLDLKRVTDPVTGETYQTFEPDPNYKNFTYTIDPKNGTITQNDLTDASSICGLIMSDNFKWPGYGDYGTAYLPATDTIKTMPAGIKVEEWAYRYNNSLSDQARLVHVGISGDKIYIDQISEDDPTAVIEGTIKDGKAIFESGQYLGRSLDIFMYYTAALCKFTIPEGGDGSYKEAHYTSLPRLVFDYDAKNKVLTAPENHTLLLHCSNNIPQDTELLNYYIQAINPQFECYVERAAKPADPTVLNYDDSYWDAFGYSWIQLQIPLQDVNGGFIKPENLAYQLFIKLGENVEPYTLYADEYSKLEKDMDIIPYSFTDDYDISAGGENIVLRQTGFDDIGVQSINYSGGVENRSNIAWFKGSAEAIENVEACAKPVKETIYHSLSGVRLAQPVSGLSLKTVIYTDGTMKTTKIYR